MCNSPGCRSQRSDCGVSHCRRILILLIASLHQSVLLTCSAFEINTEATCQVERRKKKCWYVHRHCHDLTVPAASPATMRPPGTAARALASLIAESCPRSSKSGRPCMRIMFSCEWDVRTTADCLESEVPHMANTPPYSSLCSHKCQDCLS